MAGLKAQLEIGADVSGVEAGVRKAKKSINELGVAVQDAGSKGAKSIDRYVQSLQVQSATMGKSSREVDLYKLALRGASDAQLKAADSALRMKEGYERGELAAQRLRSAFVTLGAIAATGFIAATVAIDQLIKKAGDFQDLSEKYGDSAENLASLAVAAGTAGVQMDAVGSASGKLTKNLTGVDDESKAAGAAIKALGLDLKNFKELSPASQLETVAKALGQFEDGANKTAVAMALFGKTGADLLPFLKELGVEGGRQAVLTAEQIRLADEYSDRQAKLRAEIALQSQVLATQLIPTLNQFGGLIADLAKDQEHAATASELLKSAMGGAVVVFQTIAVIASDVGFVFKGVGREIGAIAAQLVALARLDFQGFTAISKAVSEDAERARAELDRFQARVMALGQPQTAAAAAGFGTSSTEDRGFTPTRKKLKFDGPKKKDETDKSAEQIAKAQLAFDLEQIKRASEAVLNTYSNGEKMLESARASGLLGEQDYYAQKVAFLRANAGEQEQALQQELARLQKQKLVGKEKIDNDRAILEVKAKLAKVQADTATNEAVLADQATAAIRRQAAAMLSAKQAAVDYYEEVNRQQQRELAGIGVGNRARSLTAGVNQIEDRYAQQRRDLENELARLQVQQGGTLTDEQRRQYADRLSIIDDFQSKSLNSYIAYFASLTAQQGNWAAGATEALQNYYDESQDIFGQTEELVTNAFGGMEDALVNFVTTGKLSFKDLANSIIADIARMVIKSQVTGPLAGYLNGLLGGGGGGGVNFNVSGSDLDMFYQQAKGGVWQTSGLSAYSNTVVNKPTMFAFARGAGLMGEAGPEAIMPLKRGPDGRLGVEAGGGGGGPIINMYVTTTDTVSKTELEAKLRDSNRMMVAALDRQQRYARG